MVTTLNILAYLSIVFILSSYLLLAAKKDLKYNHYFNWANFLGALILGPYDIYYKAYAGAIISIAFGLIGLIGIIKYYVQM